MSQQFFITYCSPAGSTRHVARVIENTLESLSVKIHTLDLDYQDSPDAFQKFMVDSGPEDCLFVGSPVYRDLAVPPVMEFLEKLPKVDGCCAVPFVTWGGAFSGIALWQMGQTLEKKGFQLVGGAKILAVHSMMWSHGTPVGQGHPDSEDDKLVRDMTQEIYTRLIQGKLEPLPLERLDYNPQPHTLEAKKKVGQPWLIIPKSVEKDRCTLCGTCEDECPVDAITLDEYPQFANTCFDCFNCIRLCPEEAIIPKVTLDQIHPKILDRVRIFNEQPQSQIFRASPVS